MSVGGDIQCFIEGIKSLTVESLSCSLCHQYFSCVKPLNVDEMLEKYKEKDKESEESENPKEVNPTIEDLDEQRKKLFEELTELFSASFIEKGLILDFDEFEKYDQKISVVKRDGTFIRHMSGRYKFKDILNPLPPGSKICDACLSKYEFEPVYNGFCMICDKGKFTYNCETYNVDSDDCWSTHGAVSNHNDYIGIFVGDTICSEKYEEKWFLAIDQELRDYCEKINKALEEIRYLNLKKGMIKSNIKENPDEELRKLNVTYLRGLQKEIENLHKLIEREIICNDCMPKLLNDRKIVCVSSDRIKCLECTQLRKDHGICRQCYSGKNYSIIHTIGKGSCKEIYESLHDKSVIICPICSNIKKNKETYNELRAESFKRKTS